MENKLIEAEHVAKPLVTFALFAFNQEEFIDAAIAGALAQTYSPLQIILSDDCSNDSTFDRMVNAARNYTGPHRIVLNRNPVNIGIGRHINKLNELAEGEWIVGAAGDDVSLPHRVTSIMVAAARNDIRAMSVWSRARHMSADGCLLDAYEASTGDQYTLSEMVSNRRVVMGCSHAWQRIVFDTFGPLYHKVLFEDNAISFRSFLLGDIAYIDETLVHYRQHNSNATNYVTSLGADALSARMYKRRQLAVVGIYQRLLDVATLRLRDAGADKKVQGLNRALLRHLIMQTFKMNLLHRFPFIQRAAAAVQFTRKARIAASPQRKAPAHR